MSKIAYITSNLIKQRYELWIMGQLKAYTTGDLLDEHEQGKKDLCKAAAIEGYTVLNR